VFLPRSGELPAILAIFFNDHGFAQVVSHDCTVARFTVRAPAYNALRIKT